MQRALEPRRAAGTGCRGSQLLLGPVPAQLPRPGQESSPQDRNSLSVNPYTLVLKVDTFSLWSQLFSSFSAALSRRTEAAAPWGADAAGTGSSLVAVAGPSREWTRAVFLGSLYTR